jgi:hypothetical protein
MKRILIPALIALGLTFAGLASPALAQTPNDYISPGEAVSDNMTMGGCVIRFDTLSSTGRSVVPRIHANTAHHCVGVESVRVDWSNGDLIVDYTNNGTAVVTTLVGSDESFTARDIFCGASGGLAYERISCYREGVKVPAWSKALYGPAMNLWLISIWWRE